MSRNYMEEFLAKVREQITIWNDKDIKEELRFDGIAESLLDIIDSEYILTSMDDDGKKHSVISGNLKLAFQGQESKMESDQEEFIDHIRDMKEYWMGQGTAETKLSGFVFSILVALDGGTVLSPYYLAPKNKKNENIAGYLHELLHERK